MKGTDMMATCKKKHFTGLAPQLRFHRSAAIEHVVGHLCLLQTPLSLGCLHDFVLVNALITLSCTHMCVHTGQRYLQIQNASPHLFFRVSTSLLVACTLGRTVDRS